jgi:hypothetical protein
MNKHIKLFVSVEVVILSRLLSLMITNIITSLEKIAIIRVSLSSNKRSDAF